jgi:RNA polymerase sigma factor (sigma-70 family)
MRHRKVSLSEKSQLKIPYYDFDYSETNDCDIAKMKKVLNQALKSLTERQRYCICNYYLNGKKMKTIAEELNINPSTVTRHIKSAKRNLKRIASCYS